MKSMNHLKDKFSKLSKNNKSFTVILKENDNRMRLIFKQMVLEFTGSIKKWTKDLMILNDIKQDIIDIKTRLDNVEQDIIEIKSCPSLYHSKRTSK